MSLFDKYEIAVAEALTNRGALRDVLMERTNDWSFCDSFLEVLEKYIEEKVEDAITNYHNGWHNE